MKISSVVQGKSVYLCIALFAAVSVVGCNGSGGTISFSRKTVDVGHTHVGDSVSAAFRMRNRTDVAMTVTFLPECDCTVLSTDSMELAPRGLGKLEVRAAADAPGEFHKYVYVQTAGSDDFFTIEVKGYAE
ncbi:MAG: DUF1573 domain-containing protein [Bacteroidaceae bacterium]